jgi:site-specific recombinase XerD
MSASPSPLEPYLDAFVAYLRAERGLSPRTVEAYASDLVGYLESLRPTGVPAPDAVRQEHVRGHLATLGRRLSSRSLARHLAAIRMFHRFLVAERHAKDDPPSRWRPRGNRGGSRLPHLDEWRRCSRRRGTGPPPGYATGRCCTCSTPPGSG